MRSRPDTRFSPDGQGALPPLGARGGGLGPGAEEPADKGERAEHRPLHEERGAGEVELVLVVVYEERQSSSLRGWRLVPWVVGARADRVGPDLGAMGLAQEYGPGSL